MMNNNGLAVPVHGILNQLVKTDIRTGRRACDPKTLFILPQALKQILQQTFLAAKVAAAKGNLDYRIVFDQSWVFSAASPENRSFFPSKILCSVSTKRLFPNHRGRDKNTYLY